MAEEVIGYWCLKTSPPDTQYLAQVNKNKARR
jgi:hypothetical protein